MTRTALLIGTDEYVDDRFGGLLAPRGDVVRLAEVLRDPSIGGFDSVHTMINRPWHEQVAAIGDVTSGRQLDDLVLLYIPPTA